MDVISAVKNQEETRAVVTGLRQRLVRLAKETIPRCGDFGTVRMLKVIVREADEDHHAGTLEEKARHYQSQIEQVESLCKQTASGAGGEDHR